MGLDYWNLLAGFALGVVASLVVWITTEWMARPLLQITLDEEGPAAGYVGQPFAFFNVRVRIVPREGWRRILSGRRPAWRCTAFIEVFRPDGTRAINERIPARWSSQPEPLVPVVINQLVENVASQSSQPEPTVPVVLNQQVVNRPSHALMMQGRIIDVHGHFPESMPLIIKFQGVPDCYVFTNESYFHEGNRNAAWGLPLGRYQIRVTVNYEGTAVQDFELQNGGPNIDEVRLALWPRSQATESSG